jgi:GDPmannose 4,6-dehydratase
MWKMLQQDEPDDYVVGSGVAPTIREFVQEAFDYAGMDWEQHVEIDQRYFRPTEVDHLLADSSKAKRELGWEPKITFKPLVRIMVDADLEAVGAEPIGEGVRIMEENFGSWHRWDTGVTAVLNSTGNGIE